MSIDEAKRLLRSLVQRLERNSGSENYSLRGSISFEEFEALSLLTRSTDQPKGDAEAPARAAAKSVVLELSSLDPKNAYTEPLLLCLDFGTAMSKAWATGAQPERQIPILLGLRAGESVGLPLVSAVFIARNGRIYFGKAAETLGNDNAKHGHKRFDNLKRTLSQGADDRDPDAVPVDHDINPTNVAFSQGDFIVLYLAFLTDLALTDLCQAEAKRLRGLPEDAEDVELTADEKRVRNVRRRFAIPCFTGQRSATVRKWLRSAILKAQVLADTFSGRWQHLTVEQARSALDQLPEQKSLPTFLFDGIDAVREPVAAASSRYADTLDELLNSRGLQADLMRAGIDRLRRSLLVIDAGAGTTDFAMLTAVHAFNEDTTTFFTVSPSIDFEYAAGNSIDEALRKFIIRKHGIARDSMSEGEYQQVESELDARIREIKETVLREGVYEAVLGPATVVSISRDEFLADPELANISARLRNKLAAVLGKLGDSYFEKMHDRTEDVMVLVTGGCGQMEMFQMLTKGQMTVRGVHFRFRPVRDVPEFIRREGLENVYPQMAVSAGGAAILLPKEAAELPAQIAVAVSGERVLEKYRIKGPQS